LSSSSTSWRENPRLLGVLNQRLAPLRLLDLAGAQQQCLQVAIFDDQLRRGLDADAGNARHVVGGNRRLAPAPRRPFSGGTPNFSITSDMPMRRSFMVSNMVTQSVTSCIRSLSDENDGRGPRRASQAIRV